MRQRRFDPKDPGHVEVRANPAAYTRASRRAAGLRGGQHVQLMRDFHAEHNTLPRAVRRLMRDPAKSVARMKKNWAKVNRALAQYGAHL